MQDAGKPCTAGKPYALINASNLHVGGGVQVAASVLTEARGLNMAAEDVAVAVSPEVERSLPEDISLNRVFREVIRLSTSGLNVWDRRARAVLDRFDVVFTVFGPLYRFNPPFRSIVGFAQPWIIYPRSEAYARLSFFAKMLTCLKYKIQWFYYRRADLIVVELEHVRAALVNKLGIPPSRVRVIHNCVASFYKNPEVWQPVTVPQTDNKLRLGFVGRNYPHKNTSIFPEIVLVLKKCYGIDAQFVVTFTQAEWMRCTPAFRRACINVGPLTPLQCPRFYQSVDLIVFPSLLECFSATPLEAMAMRRPLVASDRPFNREVCGKYARYFDPLSATEGAAAVASLVTEGRPDAEFLLAAQEYALSFGCPKRRAVEYLSLFGDVENIDDCL